MKPRPLHDGNVEFRECPHACTVIAIPRLSRTRQDPHPPLRFEDPALSQYYPTILYFRNYCSIYDGAFAVLP